MVLCSLQQVSILCYFGRGEGEEGDGHGGGEERRGGEGGEVSVEGWSFLGCVRGHA